MEVFGKLVHKDIFLVDIADIIEYSATDSFNRRKVFEHYEIVDGLLDVMQRFASLAVIVFCGIIV
jgi:hypothetical protein